MGFLLTRRLCLSLTAAICGLAPGLGHAATMAAETGVFTLSPCPSFCGGPGLVSESAQDGGEGVAVSQAAIAGGPNGSGRASAALAGGQLELPVLRAEAVANPNAIVTANAAGMQKLVYRGPQSLFTLDLTLEGEVIDGSQPPDASLFINAMVLLGQDIDFVSDYATFAFEIVPGTPGIAVLDETAIDFFALGLFDAGPQSVTRTLSFTLDDGDEVLIWASLVALGLRGGTADAYDTALFEFTGGNLGGLAVATSVVPLPAPWVLLTSGLLLLAGGAGRRSVPPPPLPT